jgi:acetyl esterase/lipase
MWSAATHDREIARNGRTPAARRARSHGAARACTAALLILLPLLAACASRAHSAASTSAPPADTSAVKTKYLDVAYADRSPAEKLDIYLPGTGSGPFPVIIRVHGGAFLQGDKADIELTPMLSGLARGYAVVSVNYRLSSEAQAPAQINDVKAALRFLRANAEKYRLDPERFAIWGSSAGGNLAALAGTSAGVSTLSDPSLGNAHQSDRVQAVVDWFGLIDFSAMDAQLAKSGTGPAFHNAADSPESKVVGAPLPTVPDRVAAMNPTTYITKDDPPFLIEHGTADEYVPVQQSRDFAAALAKTLGPGAVTLKLIPGAVHVDPTFETPENIKMVLDWIDSKLKR